MSNTYFPSLLSFSRARFIRDYYRFIKLAFESLYVRLHLCLRFFGNPDNNHSKTLAMKKLFTKILLVFLIISAFALRSGDVLTDLKLNQEEVENLVFDQLTAENPGLTLSYESRQAAQRFSASMRVASVRAMYAVVRTYVQSDDFRRRYDSWLRGKYRVEAGDELPETVSSSDLQAAQEAQLNQVMESFSSMSPQILVLMLPQQMAEIQQQMRNADAPAKAALTRDIMVLRELQPMATTKPAEFKTRYLTFMKRSLTQQLGRGLVALEEQNAKDQEKAHEYRNRLAEYQANADPDLVLKKQLREFVDLVDSVDFDAETVKQGYRTEFVRADYRAQSREWKQLYRLGREPVLVARDLARAWLIELK